MKLLFTLLNLLFLAAAVYLGHAAYQKISLDQKFYKPEISKPTKKAVSSKRKPALSPENYKAIVDRNLFHTKENPAEKPKSEKPIQSEPLKPTTPGVDQTITLPCTSVIVITVLLNVALMCATPDVIPFNAFFFTLSFLFVGLAIY